MIATLAEREKVQLLAAESGGLNGADVAPDGTYDRLKAGAAGAR